jgi:tetratricopeptide (TPR) repeat protein
VTVESVAWVTERKNVLSLVFYLLAIHVYLFRSGFGVRVSAAGLEDNALTPDTRYPIPETRFYILSLALFLCALFSKTVTASFPAAVLLILWWKNGRLRLRDFLPLIPFFIVGAGMGAFTGYLEKTHVGADGTHIPELNLRFVQRCLIAGRAIWFYFGKILFPHPLVFIYPRWDEIDHPTVVQGIFPALVVVVTVALFVLRNRIGRGVVVAWLLFCGTLVPALGFVNVYPMRFSYVADHFQYHASIAGIVLIVSTISTYLAPRMRGAIWGLIIFICAALTWVQTHIYINAEAQWRDTLSRNSDSWMVQTNLAHVLRERGTSADLDEAEGLYRRALELAPELHDTHTNVGMMEGMRGNTEAALKQFDESLRINPTFAPAYYGRGQVLYRAGRNDEAIENFRKAVELAPGYYEAQYRLAMALEKKAAEFQKKFETSKDPADAAEFQRLYLAAINALRAAVAANSEYFDAHEELALRLFDLKQYDEAIWNLREALRIRPDSAEAWTNLGNAYYQTRHFTEAADAFGHALAINPNLDPARRGYQAAKMRGG